MLLNTEAAMETWQNTKAVFNTEMINCHHFQALLLVVDHLQDTNVLSSNNNMPSILKQRSFITFFSLPSHST